jgi:hypothetical protein
MKHQEPSSPSRQPGKASVVSLWLSANLVLPLLCAEVLAYLGPKALGVAITTGVLANAYACWRLSEYGPTPEFPLRAARCALMLVASLTAGTSIGVYGCMTFNGFPRPWWDHSIRHFVSGGN